MKSIIYLIMYNIKNRLYGKNEFDITGPLTISRSFKRFFGKNDYNIV